ncbi:MAG: flagellar basal body-associated FliL family protein [Alphaproteobacteria bacterium]|jgi:flagellar FliL protein|uniref:flagellar basal body-associated FliL family protein n=1 Tax=Rhizobium sp. 'Codium 1' TaxID=2940484 RepID=UPI001E5D62ED|nr:flagellar basal body-associated FliL family protein [Rhizobium sp. 'Codium 1']MBU2327718.1 flagellar basal body-associated FliL family protein [Alphaproteobacteria bacterium]MCC8931409.1 flagellar basal body-associated FliL family protein [Rhizobium sp. 'Codium 1']
MEDPQEGEGKKKSGLMALVIPLVVLTAVGGGGGWVIGNMLAPQVKQADEAAKAAEAAAGEQGEAKKDEEGLPPISTEANGVVALEPITTNLAYPSENWIRLEVALMFNGAPDVKIAEDVHQDIMAYLRTVSLQQVEGPRGFQYLKDDVQERVDLRSEGRVSKVMFRTLVIE